MWLLYAALLVGGWGAGVVNGAAYRKLQLPVRPQPQAYNVLIENGEDVEVCTISGCELPDVNGLYVARHPQRQRAARDDEDDRGSSSGGDENDDGNPSSVAPTVFFGQHFTLLRALTVVGAPSSIGWSLFTSAAAPLDAQFVAPEYIPLFVAAGNGTPGTWVHQTQQPTNVRAAASKYMPPTAAARSDDQQQRTMQVQCEVWSASVAFERGVVSSAAELDRRRAAAGRRGRRGWRRQVQSRAYQECEHLLAPHLAQPPIFGDVPRLDHYMHAPTLTLLRAVCEPSVGTAVHQCAAGTVACDELFLQYHAGMGSAHTRLDELEYAKKYLEPVVASFASSPSLTEEQARSFGMFVRAYLRRLCAYGRRCKRKCAALSP